MITREELLADPPEDTDYVYVEEGLCGGVRIHYHLKTEDPDYNGWYVWDKNEVHLDPDPWHSLLNFGRASDELPRRWAAQREPLHDWIKQLGLWVEYGRLTWSEVLGEPGNPRNLAFDEWPPTAQEKLPEFALNFLKSKVVKKSERSAKCKSCGVHSSWPQRKLHCHGCGEAIDGHLLAEESVQSEPELEPDFFVLSPVVYADLIGDTEALKRLSKDPVDEVPVVNMSQYEREDKLFVNKDGEVCNVTKEAAALWKTGAEPACHCNLHVGHRPDCAWKKWKDQHGT